MVADVNPKMRRKIQDHIGRQRRLREAERRFLKEQPVNEALGAPAHWCRTPRSGATWSEAEEVQLLTWFHERLGKQDIATVLCSIAWDLGRTALSVERRLCKLRGTLHYRTVIQWL